MINNKVLNNNVLNVNGSDSTMSNDAMSNQAILKKAKLTKVELASKMDGESVLTADNQPLWLINFIEIYQNLSIDNLATLADLYHQDVVFKDPLHTIHGFSSLANYFEQLYQNVPVCNFVINDILADGDSASIYWTMTYQHTKLNAGNDITVEGCSKISGQGTKVIYHRDYLDVGQMLYEHIPLLGKVIMWLKKRVSV